MYAYKIQKSYFAFVNLMITYLSIVNVINVRTEAYVNNSDTTIAKLHPIFPRGIG